MSDISIVECFTRLDRDLLERACSLIDRKGLNAFHNGKHQSAHNMSQSSASSYGSSYNKQSWGNKDQSNNSWQQNKRKWDNNNNDSSYKSSCKK